MIPGHKTDRDCFAPCGDFELSLTEIMKDKISELNLISAVYYSVSARCNEKADLLFPGFIGHQCGVTVSELHQTRSSDLVPLFAFRNCLGSREPGGKRGLAYEPGGHFLRRLRSNLKGQAHIETAAMSSHSRLHVTGRAHSLHGTGNKHET
jgi:hypothetical protein